MHCAVQKMRLIASMIMNYHVDECTELTSLIRKVHLVG